MKTLIAVLCSVLATMFAPSPASATVMDNGVDPENLGTGQWIYFMEQATNRLGGNVEGVTDIPSLMRFYKKSGVDFIIVKSGTGAQVFPENNSQFTKELVDAAHKTGLKIFGYTRSDGKDVPGEIALAISNIELGADGFVIDAEAEWESHKLKDAHAKAIELCKGIKARYPNKFLGHSPFPIISLHASFPYKEFGLYCDAVMPQAYWKSIRVSPSRMVEWMNEEWHAWHKSLTDEFKNAIKPIAPIGQGWSPDSDRIMKAEEISEFVAALNHHPDSASPTGYKGVSYWRTDLHTAGMWRSIKKARIGDPNTTPKELVRSEGPKTAKSDTSEGQSNSEVEEPEETNKDPEQKAVARETIEVPDHANDFGLDNDSPDVSFVGKWFFGKAGHGFLGLDYSCANSTAAGKPTATAVYRPLIRNAGLYDIYVWYVQHPNRSTKAPWFISHEAGSEIIPVNQTKGGSKWHLLAEAKPFGPGTDGFVSISNDTGETEKVIVADCVRFVRRDDPPQDTTNSGN